MMERRVGRAGGRFSLETGPGLPRTLDRQAPYCTLVFGMVFLQYGKRQENHY
jgi:hypothetical protein